MITAHANGQLSFVGRHGSRLRDASMRAFVAFMVKDAPEGAARERATAVLHAAIRAHGDRFHAADYQQVKREIVKLFNKVTPKAAYDEAKGGTAPASSTGD